MHMLELIEKKKNGGTLTGEEIRFMIQGYTDGSIPDYQMSAFLMAVMFQGMTDRETVGLTLSMEYSGDVVDLSPLGEYTADKHSSGGVGDKTSLVLCPIMAACGAKMAKMSGRGLGHTGGTIDKLESFPGFSVDVTQEQFMQQANTVGFVIAGQTAELAPADKKMYALRDVTGTVGSIPLIASSIMSKKLASGSRTIVLDVKTGSGAFMSREKDAFLLAETMVKVGKRNHRNMAAVVTDMDRPLGFAVGNALEVKEAVAVLRGEDVPDLKEVVFALGGQILVRSGLCKDEAEAKEKMQSAIDSGAALDRLARMVEAQKGDPRAVYDLSLLPDAPVKREVLSPVTGYVRKMNTTGIGNVCVHLGGGREVKDAPIDLSVGMVFRKKTGDAVREGECLCVIHAATEESALTAEEEILSCYTFGDKAPRRNRLIRGVVS